MFTDRIDIDKIYVQYFSKIDIYGDWTLTDSLEMVRTSDSVESDFEGFTLAVF